MAPTITSEHCPKCGDYMTSDGQDFFCSFCNISTIMSPRLRSKFYRDQRLADAKRRRLTQERE